MGKFAIVGASNTIIDFAAFYLLHSVFNVYFIIAHIIGFLVAVVNGFYFNATWTFQCLDKKCWHKQAVSYAIVGVIGLGLSTLTIYIGNYFLHVYLAKVLATFVSFSWNYIASKIFVFKVSIDTQDSE